MLELDVICYIPDRLSEGYGMSCAAVDKLAEEDVSLIVTVDNGIVALAEIEHAASLGIDVVVTDHHRCGERLPVCSAVVDPCILSGKTPARDLCGAGVAYALICALADSVGLFEEVRRYVPIVMVGTLGDAVALTGDNRILVKYGMEHLFDFGWIGLEQLLEKAASGKRNAITSTFLLFYLVPKLNAAGAARRCGARVPAACIGRRTGSGGAGRGIDDGKRQASDDGGRDRRESHAGGK